MLSDSRHDLNFPPLIECESLSHAVPKRLSPAPHLGESGYSALLSWLRNSATLRLYSVEDKKSNRRKLAKETVVLGKNPPSAMISVRYPACPYLGLNPGRRCGIWLRYRITSVDGWCAVIQAGMSRGRVPMRSLKFLNLGRFLPAALDPGVNSAPNRMSIRTSVRGWIHYFGCNNNI
jgi:hypothetical protein